MERNVYYKGKPALLIKIDNFPLPKSGISGIDLNIIAVGTIVFEGKYLSVMMQDITDSEVTIQESIISPVSTDYSAKN